MELRQLRYFIAVAEESNYSRAAKRLHVSQPPLSVQIRSLERELDVQLFDRTNRGATLTKAGSAFYEEAKAIFGRLDHAGTVARQVHRGDAGLLRIGFVSIADFSVLPPALKRFRSRHPLVDVQLHELTTDAQIRELQAGRLDLGVGLAPVLDPDLRFEGIMREELVLAAPANLRRRRGKTAVAIDLRGLSQQSFIIPPRDVAPGLYDVTISLCQAAGFVPRIQQHARQMQTIVGLVSSGMGFALVPSSVRMLKRPNVQFQRLRGTRAFVELGIIRQRTGNDALVDRFAASLRPPLPARRDACMGDPKLM